MNNHKKHFFSIIFFYGCILYASEPSYKNIPLGMAKYDTYSPFLQVTFFYGSDIAMGQFKTYLDNASISYKYISNTVSPYLVHLFSIPCKQEKLDFPIDLTEKVFALKKTLNPLLAPLTPEDHENFTVHPLIHRLELKFID